MPLRNQTELHLPFEGEWLVYWGGDKNKLNQHRLGMPAERYAFDFVKVDAHDNFYRGNVPRNGNSYSWGQDILAPGDGEVIQAINDIPDNRPGEPNSASLFGNFLLIKHAEEEFSVLAHLQRGSLRALVGQEVQLGDSIAKCGNSGNSDAPHLHYHLQNSADVSFKLPPRESPKGVKAYFADALLERDGIASIWKRRSPIKGDLVSNS